MPVDSYDPRFLGNANVPGGTSGVKPTVGGYPTTGKAVGQPKLSVFDGFHALNDGGLLDANGAVKMAPANTTPSGSKDKYPTSQYGGGVTSYDDNGTKPGQTVPVGNTSGVVGKKDSRFDDSSGA